MITDVKKNWVTSVYFTIAEYELPFITAAFWKHVKCAILTTNRRNRSELAAAAVFDTKIGEIFDLRFLKSGADSAILLVANSLQRIITRDQHCMSWVKKDNFTGGEMIWIPSSSWLFGFSPSSLCSSYPPMMMLSRQHSLFLFSFSWWWRFCFRWHFLTKILSQLPAHVVEIKNWNKL